MLPTEYGGDAGSLQDIQRTWNILLIRN
jgi:hypothetical protein